MEAPTVRDILEARRRIDHFARRTPLQPSDWLAELAGCPVHLKLECWQRTNSFKARGAYNAVAMMDEETRGRGLVTASAGNHGQAVALVAREFGVPADIFVPADAPATKQDRIRAFGAELHTVDGFYDEAAEAAHEFSETEGAYYLHAFADPAVVAGQGTVGLEIVETLPSVRTVIVPVGGGGLIAGIGRALRGLAPDARLIGVQSDATYSMHAAFEAGRVVETVVGRTLADGLAGEVVEESYRRARAVADEMRLVEESRLPSAIRSLYRRDGVVAEGAGATGPALIQQGDIELEGPVVIVISGGNIDAEKLAVILGST